MKRETASNSVKLCDSGGKLHSSVWQSPPKTPYDTFWISPEVEMTTLHYGNQMKSLQSSRILTGNPLMFRIYRALYLVADKTGNDVECGEFGTAAPII